MADPVVEKKHAELQLYVPYLERLISNLKRTRHVESKAQQLSKMEMLYDMLTKRDKKKLKIESLVKCEIILIRILKKIDWADKPPPPMHNEIREISEPDSPAANIDIFQPPIEIPTERKDSPEPEKILKMLKNRDKSNEGATSSSSKSSSPIIKKVISSELTLDELLKQREALEMQIFCSAASSNNKSISSDKVPSTPQSPEPDLDPEDNSIPIFHDCFDIAPRIEKDIKTVKNPFRNESDIKQIAKTAIRRINDKSNQQRNSSPDWDADEKKNDYQSQSQVKKFDNSKISAARSKLQNLEIEQSRNKIKQGKEHSQFTNDDESTKKKNYSVRSFVGSVINEKSFIDSPRSRDRSDDSDRERSRDFTGDKSRESDRERSRDFTGDKSRESDRERSRDFTGDKSRESDRERSRDFTGDKSRESDRERSRDFTGDKSRESDRERSRDFTGDKSRESDRNNRGRETDRSRNKNYDPIRNETDRGRIREYNRDWNKETDRDRIRDYDRDRHRETDRERDRNRLSDRDRDRIRSSDRDKNRDTRRDSHKNELRDHRKRDDSSSRDKNHKQSDDSRNHSHRHHFHRDDEINRKQTPDLSLETSRISDGEEEEGEIIDRPYFPRTFESPSPIPLPILNDERDEITSKSPVPDSSKLGTVFTRLGKKIDITENFKIKINNDKIKSQTITSDNTLNDKSIEDSPITSKSSSSIPFICDVLKSPPLSANDIDDLLNESADDDNEKNQPDLDAIRKKLAKISTNSIDPIDNTKQTNISDFDSQRLAFKYNPHPRQSLDDVPSPTPDYDDIHLPSPCESPSTVQSNLSNMNTFPGVRSNDPRLRNRPLHMETENFVISTIVSGVSQNSNITSGSPIPVLGANTNISNPMNTPQLSHPIPTIGCGSSNLLGTQQQSRLMGLSQISPQLQQQHNIGHSSQIKNSPQTVMPISIPSRGININSSIPKSTNLPISTLISALQTTFGIPQDKPALLPTPVFSNLVNIPINPNIPVQPVPPPSLNTITQSPTFNQNLSPQQTKFDTFGKFLENKMVESSETQNYNRSINSIKMNDPRNEQFERQHKINDPRHEQFERQNQNKINDSRNEQFERQNQNKFMELSEPFNPVVYRKINPLVNDQFERQKYIESRKIKSNEHIFPPCLTSTSAKQPKTYGEYRRICEKERENKSHNQNRSTITSTKISDDRTKNINDIAKSSICQFKSMDEELKLQRESKDKLNDNNKSEKIIEQSKNSSLDNLYQTSNYSKGELGSISKFKIPKKTSSDKESAISKEKVIISKEKNTRDIIIPKEKSAKDTVTTKEKTGKEIITTKESITSKEKNTAKEIITSKYKHELKETPKIEQKDKTETKSRNDTKVKEIKDKTSSKEQIESKMKHERKDKHSSSSKEKSESKNKTEIKDKTQSKDKIHIKDDKIKTEAKDKNKELVKTKEEALKTEIIKNESEPTSTVDSKIEKTNFNTEEKMSDKNSDKKFEIKNIDNKIYKEEINNKKPDAVKKQSFESALQNTVKEESAVTPMPLSRITRRMSICANRLSDKHDSDEEIYEIKSKLGKQDIQIAKPRLEDNKLPIAGKITQRRKSMCASIVIKELEKERVDAKIKKEKRSSKLTYQPLKGLDETIDMSDLDKIPPTINKRRQSMHASTLPKSKLEKDLPEDIDWPTKNTTKPDTPKVDDDKLLVPCKINVRRKSMHATMAQLEFKPEFGGSTESLTSKRKSAPKSNYFYEVCPEPTDNSELSTDNIIFGKRRNRSLVNMNENALQGPKYVKKQKPPLTEKDKTIEHKETPKTSSITKTKSQKDLNSSRSSLDESIIDERIDSTPASTRKKPGPKPKSQNKKQQPVKKSLPIPSTSKIDTKDDKTHSDVKTNDDKTNVNAVESFLSQISNSKKDNILEMLSKVFDGKKFEKIKAILDEDDKNESDDNQSINENEKVSKAQPKRSPRSANINETSQNDEEEEEEDETNSTNIEIEKLPSKLNQKKNKPKNKKSELDRLNEDIRDMFISKGVLTATGRRMCTVMNEENEIKSTPKTDKKPVKAQHVVVDNKSNENLKTPDTKQKTDEKTKLQKLKIIVRKCEIGFKTNIDSKKIRTISRRKRGGAWAKGFISRKKKIVKSIQGSEKDKDSEVEEEEETSIVKNSSANSSKEILPTLSPLTPVKVQQKIRNKPCPKSKKINYDDDDNTSNELEEPPKSPKMPTLTALTSTDLIHSNLTTVKNVHAEMHAKSDYANKCIFCKYVGQKATSHYVLHHPDKEVFISRLPPETLSDLLDGNNNTALYAFRKNGIFAYHYRCPFCDVQQSFTRKAWIDHFSTHTGEYNFKCSGCERRMNSKSLLARHIKNHCKSDSKIIVRPNVANNKFVSAYVCNLCNYVQMLLENITKHLKTQHNHSDLNDIKKIQLINVENVSKLDHVPEDEKQTTETENLDDIDATGTDDPIISDKLEAFMAKEQTDLSLDKNFLNYMNEVSFSGTANESINEKSSKSIIDELSERLSAKKSLQVKESKTKLASIDKRRFSIAEQLTKRVQSLDENQKNIHEDDNSKDANNSSSEEMPIIYIVDNIDDDNIDNAEFGESSEQIIIPVNKPISKSRANILNQMSGTGKLLESGGDSIYARLNERLKNTAKQSPDKKDCQNNKSQSVSPQKTPSHSGIMIIDRLNKRLNTGGKICEINDNNKNANKTNSDKNSEKSSSQRQNSESDDEGNLIIDESFEKNNDDDNMDIDEELTPIPFNKNIPTTNNSSNQIVDENADDEDWEDIEIIGCPSLEAEEEQQNDTSTSKTKTKTSLQTFSRFYASLVPKNKSTSSKKSKNKDKTLKYGTSNNEIDPLQIDDVTPPLPLPDLVNDAIPSPISAELITDPSLPSEPLSDLNDISEILEPTNNNIITTNISNTLININNINEPMILLADDATIEDAMALADEFEKSIPSYKLPNPNIPIEIQNEKRNANDLNLDPELEGGIITRYRINNLGFSEIKGKIKYLCLVDLCSFMYSEMAIGLQNHYSIDHSTVKWDGYCYTCEAHICFEEDEMPLSRELKHMTEVHIKNLIKKNNLQPILNENNPPKSLAETLLAGRPKITIRRLSGDILSKSKPPETQASTSLIQSGLEKPIVHSSETIRSSNVPNVSTNLSSLISITPIVQKNQQSSSAGEIAKNKFTNLTIKNLLTAPSKPPRVPQNEISNTISNPKILNKTIHNDTTNLNTLNVVDGTIINNSIPGASLLSKTNLTVRNTNTKQIKIAPNSLLQIKNNDNSGSGLKISSVAQGVNFTSAVPNVITTSDVAQQPSMTSTLETTNFPIISAVAENVNVQSLTLPKITTISSGSGVNMTTQNQSNIISIPENVPLVISQSNNNLETEPILVQSTSSNNSSPFFKIQTVCSLNAQNQAEIPILKPIENPFQPMFNIIQSTINQVPDTNTTIPQASTSHSKGQQILMQVQSPTIENLSPPALTPVQSISNQPIKVIKPWIYPVVSKPSYIANLQLRAISLYAKYKCMSRTCFFSTSSDDILLKHFICHEYSGKSNNENTNDTFRDWLTCSYCTFNATNSTNLVDHVKSVHINDIFQCSYCFYRSCNDFNVLKHIEEYHKECRILIYVCYGERKRLASEMPYLAINRAKYVKAIPCHDCNKHFYILRNYLSHLKEHSPNTETYTCGLCGAKKVLKKFADTHLSLAHRIAVFQCIYCDMSTIVRVDMITHMAKDHPSMLLYSCVRVSPNKNTAISCETIENSTVLANLNDTVNSQYLQECAFNLDNLNFMSPSLDAQSLEVNKHGLQCIRKTYAGSSKTQSSESSSSAEQPNKTLKIFSVQSLATEKSQKDKQQTVQQNTSLLKEKLITTTLFPGQSTVAQVAIQPKPKINLTTPTGKIIPAINPKICDIITIDDDSSSEEESVNNLNTINSSVNQNNKTPVKTILPKTNLERSPSTLKIAEILQNCTDLTNSLAIAQSQQEKSLTINTTINTNTINNPIPSTSTNTTSNTTNNNLDERIIEAAKEYVIDTGYEGPELYRCAIPECSNIDLEPDTLASHYTSKHPRNRNYKCSHCTGQYSNIRGLRIHLNTHRRHRHFCYFCNYTGATTQNITKHINEQHSKNTNVHSVPLAFGKNKKSTDENEDFFITCSRNTLPFEIAQFGERLIRICERKRSLAKKSYKPDEIDQLPIQAIFNSEVFCTVCNYKTKVRTNMYRHLVMHSKEIDVASVAPVNPVPCLITNEKNFDKMINMALSSNLNKDSSAEASGSQNTSEEAAEIIKKLNVKIPEFIPLARRFICGVPSCSYLAIADYMLKYHLTTLHTNEKKYDCPHCKQEIINKHFSTDKIIQHLKFHDTKIFICSECNYIHYIKYVVEKHINDRHPLTSCDIMQCERKDGDTIIKKHQYKRFSNIPSTSTSSASSSVSRLLPATITSENTEQKQQQQKTTPVTTEEMKWECALCQLKTVEYTKMNSHINAVHSLRFRYACSYCKYGAGLLSLVMEHISDKHPKNPKQVKCAFNCLDDSTTDTVQDNRPLWTRSDPSRVKHIRGILMEEEDESLNNINTNLSDNDDGCDNLTNNSLQQKEEVTKTNNNNKNKDKKNTTNKTLRKSISTDSNLVIDESSSSSQDSISITKKSENVISKQLAVPSTSTAVPSTSTAVPSTSTSVPSTSTGGGGNKSSDTLRINSNSVDIYECHYCTTKNISFKVIYKHWQLHHCKKSTTEVVTQIFSRPFAFKVVGCVAQDTEEISTYKITFSHMKTLLLLGQKLLRFQCNKCWRLYADSASVADHQKVDHVNVNVQNCRCLTFKNKIFFICNFCGYASSLECKTAAHILNHYEGLKKCVKCNLEFDKFLDYIRHLPVHKITAVEFLKNDPKIDEFWGKIITLFPNGLSMNRSNVPKRSGVSDEDLLQNVTNEIEAALKQTAAFSKSKKLTPQKDLNKSTSNDENFEGKNNDMILPVISRTSLDSDIANNNDSEAESIASSSTTVKKNQKKSKRKKKIRDSDWVPGSKKRKTNVLDSSSESSSDDDLPLTLFSKPKSVESKSSEKILIGPKFTQSKFRNSLTPYSYYGKKSENVNLENIMIKANFGDTTESHYLTVSRYAEIVPINCKVIVEKLHPNILKRKSINLLKRKMGENDNIIIDDSDSYSYKKFKN